MKNKTIYICLAIVGTTMAVAMYITMRSGQMLNGDYALYVCQAKSLFTGTQTDVLSDMKTMLDLSTYKYYSPALYPWGFPLLLALPLYFAGINYIAFKLMLFVCILITLGILTKDFIRRKEADIGIWVILLLGLNFNLITSTDRIISGLPYLLFLTASLCLIRCYRPFSVPLKRAAVTAIALGATLFLTIQTRTEGVILLMALLAHLAVEYSEQRKNITNRLQAGVLALLPYLVSSVLFVSTLSLLPPGFMEHTGHVNEVTARGLIDNLLFYLNESSFFFLPIVKCAPTIGPGVLFFFIVAGIISSGKRSVAEVIYFSFHILLLLVWPYQVTRYVMPLMPLMCYFFVKGVYQVPKWIGLSKIPLARIMLTTCVGFQLVTFGLGIAYHDKEYDEFDIDVESQNAVEMLGYIKHNTRKEDIVACSESRTIYLYTGRKSCNLFGSIEDTTEKADWYVVFRNRGNYLQHSPEELSLNPDCFGEVYSNPDFLVYKVIKQ